MQHSFSVIICCAGVGRRLQMAKTKALITIMDRPLIAWQLLALKNVSDIRIVVGYQAHDVIDYVKTIRNDVLFVFNHDYETTGTAASLARAAKGVKDLVLSLDGDLLITPPSLQAFIANQQPLLGFVPVSTEEPSYAALNRETQKIDFFGTPASAETHTVVEWSGLCCLSSSQLQQSIAMGLDKKHVYQLIEPYLPMPSFAINAQEVDTPSDFEAAERFLTANYHLWEEML